LKNDQAQSGNPVADFKRCPAWGQGGQFVFDPVTKTRTAGGVPTSTTAPEIPPESVDGPAVVTTAASHKSKGKESHG